ncbi:MAG: S8 family serine peptidase [Chloracidobacterium sp.]|nr:S8 family serine peptidase [Chloracidobacterium sp.]
MLFLILALPSIGLSQHGGPGRVEGEILVKFRPSTGPSAARSIARKRGASVIERFGDLGWTRLSLPSGKRTQEAIAEFLNDPSVEAAQPNFYYRLHLTPNDPSFGSLWGMAKISAPEAWETATGSPEVVIANIDTGTRLDHEDLAANLWTNSNEVANNGIDDDNNGFVDDFYGYDFFFNDPDPSDQHNHGTHTAGTLGAVGNNGLGVVGVNWNVKIMSIKIYNSSGFGTTSAMLINAYNYVRMMKLRGVNIRVTNNSYGGCDEACGYDQATKDAIDALGDAGVLQVFSAGNDGNNSDVLPSYPAAYDSPSIISVANSTSSDTRNTSSNFGPLSVDLAAPGTSILSTLMSAANYGSFSGTSMAAPHVAGAAALLAAHRPELSLASLKATLLNTVDQLPAWNGIVRSGGRLNVARALQEPTVCSFQMPEDTVFMPTKGGQFSLAVSAPANCDFGAKSNANWIVVSDAASFSGNSTVTFRVRLNSTITRNSTVTVAGKSINIIQSRTGIP